MYLLGCMGRGFVSGASVDVSRKPWDCLLTCIVEMDGFDSGYQVLETVVFA